MKINPYYKYLSVEDKEHIEVVNYIKDKLPDVLAFHVPNESKKSKFECYKYSLMGALSGCPDFIFLFPKYVSNDSKEILFHGLAIELKAPEHNRVVKKGKNEGKIVKAVGKLSPEQEDVIQRLNLISYKAVACWGAVEAIKVINEYFKEYFELRKELKIRNYNFNLKK